VPQALGKQNLLKERKHQDEYWKRKSYSNTRISPDLSVFQSVLPENENPQKETPDIG